MLGGGFPARVEALLDLLEEAAVVEQVRGWILEQNVGRFLELLSRYLKADYAGFDEADLSTTDDGLADIWLLHMIPGEPRVEVWLARSLDGYGVSVRVQGDFDPILRARAETLTDVL